MTYFVNVEFKKHHDWHIACGKNFRGLFIASPSKEEMYADVPAAIRTLFKLNLGMDVNVYEANSPDPIPMNAITYIAEAA